MMYQYEVGQAIFPPSADSVRFDLTDGGAVLIIAMRNLSSAEKKAFKTGVQQFKFATANNIIFFLCRFGTLSWMDAPYYKYLSRPIQIERPGEGQGIAMHTMLVEATTGVLVAQKLIGLPHDMSVKLLDAVAKQPEIPDYTTRLSMTYQCFTTSDLLDRAEG
jgi:hypothetical protein